MGYVKQGFKDGDVLNASQLVKIEQGIQDNEVEIAKKTESSIFDMNVIAGGSGQYALEFIDGNTYNDVAFAIFAGNDVKLRINGNNIFMDGATIVLQYAGVLANGNPGFTTSYTDATGIMVISVMLSEDYSVLLTRSPITSIDDGTEVKY